MPESEVRDRLLRKRAAPARYDVPDEDFAQVAAGFQPPGEDENFVRCGPTDSVAAVVERLRFAGLEGAQQVAPPLPPSPLATAEPSAADPAEHEQRDGDVQQDKPQDRRRSSFQR